MNRRPLFQHEEFKAEYALAAELPYWDFLEDGECVALSDGTLVKGFRLTGLAIETWDEMKINALALGLRSFLNALPDGIELQWWLENHTDAGEQIAAHQALSGGSALIRWLSEVRVKKLEATRAAGLLRRQDLFLFVYQRPNPTGSRPFSFLGSPKKFDSLQREVHEKRLSQLSQVCETLGGSLAALGIRHTPLSEAGILGLVYRFFNPTRAKEIPAPRLAGVIPDQAFGILGSSPREQLVFSDVIQGVDSFFMDGLYHRMLTLKTLPEITHAALISKLNGLTIPYILSIQVVVPEQARELSSLQAKRRMAHSMSFSQGGRASDLESEARLNSTEALLRELLNTGQKIFYFQVSILLRSLERESLDLMTRAVLATLRELNGAEGLAEGVAGFKLFKTILPAGNSTLVRKKRIKTDNLADFLPVYQAWEGKGRPVCLFQNRLGALVSYDPFEPSLPNFNALVTGSSGAGKSFINNCILLQYLSQSPRTYVIDIGGSYRKLCSFASGQYVTTEVSGAEDQCAGINPFQLAAGETEPSPRKIKFLLSLLELILTDGEGDKLPKLDKAVLEEVILATYKSVSGTPRLSDLKRELENRPEDQNAARLKPYAQMLYPWTGDRPFGRLLDVEQGLQLDTDFVVFDLKGLSSYPDLQSVMLLIVTDFILGKIDEHPNQKKRIILDECWELLKRKASGSFMEYCVRTLRKTGSGITFITQGLEEIQASPIGPAILNNTATKLILLQRGDLGPIRTALHLNDHEMDLIRTLRQEKGVYSEAFLMADEDRAVIQLTPTPAEYWLATSDNADNRWIEEAQKRMPEKNLSEVIHWLAEKFPSGAQGRATIPELT